MAESLYIPAGSLRWPILIQQQDSSSRDAGGQVISGDWITVLSCRAKIDSTITATYKSAVQDGAIIAVATYIMTIRYPSVAITPDMQITFAGEQYKINAVNNIQQQGRFLQIFCMRIDQ